ncbi:MAG TPA: sugar kinase [Dictyobacter sp.]|jgi:2-dehydro-3-deoxygluconokinase|nr:sugar kinase [Dictyobacter sp.]
MSSIDVVSFGETMLRLTTPHGSRLETASSLHIYVGGTESNMLAGLARLGLRVSWLSALPQTPLGQNVTTELRRHGIDTTHVLWDTSNSRLGTFYVEESPDPLGIQLFYDRANSACALVDPDLVNYSVVDDARLLHLTGITPALSERAHEVFHRFLARARAQHVPLVFDVNYRAKLWSPREAAKALEEACQQAQILFCAQADAAELWGCDGEPEAILRQLASLFGQDKTLVMTMGGGGSAQLHHGEYQFEKAFPTAGQIRFGSGDAFDAGYLYAYLDGPLYQELREQAERHLTPLAFGNALAALKRTIPGDIPLITPADVRAVLLQAKQRFR